LKAKCRSEARYSGSVDFSQYVVTSTPCTPIPAHLRTNSSIVMEPALKYFRYDNAQQPTNIRASPDGVLGTSACIVGVLSSTGNVAAPTRNRRRSTGFVTFVPSVPYWLHVVLLSSRATARDLLLMFRVSAPRKFAHIVHSLKIKHIDQPYL
jgi:hypothetical protein